MKGRKLDIPLPKYPFRLVFTILESHEENGITIVDEMEINDVYDFTLREEHQE